MKWGLNATSRPASRPPERNHSGRRLEKLNDYFDREAFEPSGKAKLTHVTVLHATKGFRHINVNRLPRSLQRGR